jgi:hypothetical protein
LDDQPQELLQLVHDLVIGILAIPILLKALSNPVQTTGIRFDMIGPDGLVGYQLGKLLKEFDGQLVIALIGLQR